MASSRDLFFNTNLRYFVLTIILDHFNIISLHEKNFLILISSWGLGTLLTNRYKEPITINHYYEIAPYIKAAILTFLFLIFFIFLLRINPASMKIIYKASLIHSLIEIIAFFLFFFGKSKSSKWF